MARDYYKTAFVRAADLQEGDVARLYDHWRPIYAVNDENLDVEPHKYLEENGLSEEFVVIRYAYAEKSSPGVFEDQIMALPKVDLVEIQVSVGGSPDRGWT